MTQGAESRSAAVVAVGRVLRGGAYSNVLANQMSGSLKERDLGFGQWLLYGTLRWLLRIDRVVAEYVDKDPSALESTVQDVLRVGTFELLFGSAPARAVVDTHVDVVRQLGAPKAHGLVNAVLRRVAEGGEPEGIDPALALGNHKWLRDSLIGAWGEEETDSFFTASQQDAERWFRMRGEGVPPAGSKRHPTLDGVWRQSGSRNLPHGAWVQDPASVAVVLAVGPAPGELILDMAAAPGGKGLLLEESGARVILADAHSKRVARGRNRLTKAGSNAPWVVADGSRPPFRSQSFDAVLVDAPCTGLGTMRRRPEIRFKVTEGEVSRLAALQMKLLEAAVDLVKPSGRVVYSVCTVTPQETVEVVEPFDARAPANVPGKRWGKGVLLGPHLRDTDGMFIAEI